MIFVFTASAESYLNECLAVYQVVHGPNHQKTLDIQDELARLMVRTDRAEVNKYQTQPHCSPCSCRDRSTRCTSFF